MLVGRGAQTRLLEDLLTAAAAGSAGAVQLVGEAGIGKSALLQDVLARSTGFRVLRAVGVREEAHLAHAALLALLQPLQHLVPALPPAPGGAAGAALGLQSDSAGELVRGAACLGLLALAAESAPVLLLADDLQWWDEESWRALSFAVRRLAGERVAVVLAGRPDSGRQLAGIRTVPLHGLDAVAAEKLLAVDHPSISAGVCRQLTVRTGGNPLALLEAVRGLGRDQVRGGADLPEILPTAAGLQDYFAARTATLPAATRDLLLLAALAAHGDLGTVAAAAARAGTPLSELAAAEDAGLVTVREQRVDYRHPLVSAAVLAAASPQDRRRAHALLAEATSADATRSAWHAAAACLGPDAAVAEALVVVAMQAQRAAAPATASAAFDRAAELTPDVAVRAGRLLLAAEAALLAGATERADALAARIDVELLAGTDRGRPALVRGRAAALLGRPAAAGPLLLAAAAGLPAHARAAALGLAVDAALESADLDFARLLIRRAEQLPRYDDDPLLRLRLDRARCAVAGAAGDLAQSVPVLRRAIDGLDQLEPVEDGGIWQALGTACCDIGDLVRARRHFVTAAACARVQGDLPLLVDALAGETFAEHALGGWSAAYAAGTRALELTDAERAPYLLADLAQILAEIDAARGAEDLCRRRCAEVRGLAARLGLRQLAIRAERREALLDLGLNRLDAAAGRLQQVREQNEALGLRHPYLSPVPDLVEVYVRAGRPAEAAALVPEFEAVVGPGAPPTARARLLRTRALVAASGAYRDLFEESVRLDAAGGVGFLRARTLLCYGERLRRDRERVAARRVLRAALEVFDALEAGPWSARARLELAATGEPVGASPPAASERLTPQELQIAVLVGEGRRNKDIAAALYLSVRTVEFHLTRVYRKLAVSTRAELATRLARRDPTPVP